MTVFIILLSLSCNAMPLKSEVDKMGVQNENSEALSLVQLRARSEKESLIGDAVKVVYAVSGSRMEKYAKLLQAQFETWAPRPISEGRYFVTIGTGPSIRQYVPEQYWSALRETSCADNYAGLACKNFESLKEGLKRNADWLVILNEDNYVNTSGLEQTLSNLSREHPEYKTSPIEMGIKGCELSMCPELHGKVSICGGGGQIFNHAALSLLFRDGPEALFSEYSKKAGLQDDPIAACALQKRGGELIDFHEGLLANRIFQKREMDIAIDHHPLVMHYLTTPEVMHYVHSKMNGEKHINSKKAFDNDCCCWEESKKENQCSASKHMNAMQLPSKSFYDRMAAAYIATQH
jgi:hypothetical protein